MDFRVTDLVVSSVVFLPIHIVLVNPRFGLASDAENGSATVGSHGWSQPSVSSMYLIAQYSETRPPRSRFSS